MTSDWKDALAALSNSGTIPQAEESPVQEDNTPLKPQKKETLNIFFEKKGRNGKTATIIEGFTCTDDELANVARQLKQRIGVGGSSRGGEILLQGDWRTRAAEILRKMGYKVKGV